MDARILKKILEAQRDLYLKPNDKVLVIVTESFKGAPILRVLQSYKYHVHYIPDVQYPGQDYEINESLFDETTVSWLISNISISHSDSTRKMIDKGIFLISNPGITPDWLTVLDSVNSKLCQKHSNAIERAIGGDVAGEVHIIADDGTDLLLKVPDGNWEREIGERKGTGTNGLYGEFVTSPYDANGTYMLCPGDFLTNPLNKVNEKIRLTIHENRIVKIQGEMQAETFKRLLKDTGNFKAFNLAEFAIGINPGAPKTIHRSVVAEKLLGGIHIATGTNSFCLKESCPQIKRFRYGRYDAGIHIDCIKFNPSVFFKSEEKNEWVTILTEGKLMV